MNSNASDSLRSINEIKPIKVMEVEISGPLPEISAQNPHGGTAYGSSLVLVRIHSEPLGLIKMNLDHEPVSAQELASVVWDQLHDAIKRHLDHDGFRPVESLPAEGIPAPEEVKCLVERRDLLANAPMFSIILATRERVQSLALAMDSIAQLEYPRFELILVDSAPKTSQTEEFFTLNKGRFADKNICLRYVRTDIPGLAVAHNRGIEVAQGSLIAFTDDDVLVDRYWLTELLRGFNAGPNVGCVTGLVIPNELEAPAQVLFEEFGGFTKGFDTQIYDLQDHRPDNVLYPYTAGRFGTGANMAFRASYLQQAGGFDPALGVGTPTLGADDMAAFFAVIENGYQLVYQPTSLVKHKNRSTYKELQRQLFGYGSGLTAFLTKCILDNPLSAFSIAARVPAGLRYAFSSDSHKNQHKSRSYPKELERIERRGMLHGPIAYILSVIKFRNHRWHAPSREDEIAAGEILSPDKVNPTR